MMASPTRTPSALVDQAHFQTLATALLGDASARAAADRISLGLQAEQSDFIRFNRTQVRQATRVQQGVATLTVVHNGRRIQGTVTLAGDLDADLASLRDERAVLLDALSAVPPDPYLLLAPAGLQSRHERIGSLPTAEDLIRTLTDAAQGHDLVGFHASGPMAMAYADTTGSLHWHRADSFCTDWCVYAPGGLAVPAHLRDKAIKAQHAGRDWHAAELVARVQASAAQVPLLLRGLRPLQPGAYRAAFSASAVAELLSTLAWSGFSQRERRHGTSSLSRWAQGDFAPMAPGVNLREATAEGLAPRFSEDGFVRPEQVVLVNGGQPGDSLTGPRSAQECGLAFNSGSDDEAPISLHLDAGSLPHEQLLQALGTGIWVSNLWYLNYSDRPACRMTGMTRFACLWVENGVPVAPIAPMRFDDSLLRMLGTGLVGLTDRVEPHPNTDTYGARQWSSISCPAALVNEFRLTL